MEVYFYILVLCLSNIACLLIGTRIRQKVDNGEEVKLPTFNPIQAAKERQAKQEAEYYQSKVDTIMQNVENYDGTPYGQKDVPRG